MKVRIPDVKERTYVFVSRDIDKYSGKTTRTYICNKCPYGRPFPSCEHVKAVREMIDEFDRNMDWENPLLHHSVFIVEDE